LLFCLLCTTFSLHLFSQSYNISVKNFTAKNGLPEQSILCLTKDRKGYLWLATKSGVIRYDGYQFRRFKNPNAKHSTLCRHIVADQEGNIWPIYANGLGGVNRAKFTLDNIITTDQELVKFDDFFAGKNGPKASEILMVLNIKDNEIIILTIDGRLFRYTDTFEELFTLPSEFLCNGSTRMENLGDEIHIWHSPAYLKYSLEKKQQIDFRFTENKKKEREYLRSLYEEGVSLEIHGASKYFSPSEFEKRGLDEPIEKNTFIGFRRMDFNGIPTEVLFSPDLLLMSFLDSGETIDLSEYFKTFKTSFANPEPLSDNEFYMLNRDGFTLFKLEENHFKKALDVKSHNTRGIVGLPNGEQAILARQGIKIITPKSNDDYEIKDTSFPYSGWDMTLENDSCIIHTSVKYVGRYNFVNDTWHPIIDKTYDGVYRGVQFISPFRDHEGDFWLGTSAGLYHLDLQKDTITKFTQYNEYADMEFVSVFSFRQEGEAIHIGTANGLYVLDKEKGIINHIEASKGKEVYHSCLDENNDYWVATYGKGLIRVDSAENNIKTYLLEGSSSRARVLSVFEDDFGFIWAATEYGLARINPNTDEEMIF